MPDPRSRGARRLAALITGLQAAALAGFVVFYVVELVQGQGSDATRVLMSALLILVGSAGLAALARGWLGAAAWPGTPTIVWNVILVPIGLSLIQGNRVAVGWLVIAVSIVAIRVAWVARDPETEVLPGRDATD